LKGWNRGGGEPKRTQVELKEGGEEHEIFKSPSRKNMAGHRRRIAGGKVIKRP